MSSEKRQGEEGPKESFEASKQDEALQRRKNVFKASMSLQPSWI
jgi:hypothetical protein